MFELCSANRCVIFTAGVWAQRIRSLCEGLPCTLWFSSLLFEFFSLNFHALSHESLAGKGFVSFSLAFCESNDALMLPHFSLFFIPYLLKEGIPFYW